MKTNFFLLLLFCGSIAHAQTFTVVADSLRLPVGLETRADGAIWVVELGYGFDDGAVSLLQPDGALAPVIVGLPSRFDTTSQENVGPWHTLGLPGNQLAVTNGASGKVYFFNLSGFVPGLTPPMTAASSTSSLDISGYALSHGFLESDPYTLARDAAGDLYVADAAANAIFRADANGQLSVFATFPGFPNPLPFGPPVVDAVPTRVLAKPGGGFYVCQLTGFPFLDNAANVYEVDPGGTVSTYATGLTQLTDLALDANTGDLYVLQIGNFVLDPMNPGYAPNSAKVIRLKSDGTRETAAENFDLSAGMALDGQGNLYVTELASGRVLKRDNVATGTTTASGAPDLFTISPNPAVAAVRIDFSLPQATPVQLRILDASGRPVFTQHLGTLDAGPHRTDWTATGQPAGLYWVDLQTSAGTRTQQLILR